MRMVSDATIGIKPKGLANSKCEICATGKAKRIISRIPSTLPMPEIPYGTVSIDIFYFKMVYNQARYPILRLTSIPG